MSSKEEDRLARLLKQIKSEKLYEDESVLEILSYNVPNPT